MSIFIYVMFIQDYFFMALNVFIELLVLVYIRHTIILHISVRKTPTIKRHNVNGLVKAKQISSLIT